MGLNISVCCMWMWMVSTAYTENTCAVICSWYECSTSIILEYLTENVCGLTMCTINELPEKQTYKPFALIGRPDITLLAKRQDKNIHQIVLLQTKLVKSSFNIILPIHLTNSISIQFNTIYKLFFWF